jgi:DNA-binding NarL/FixJ family response regulator
VLIADDHQIIREGLRILLENEADMTLLAEAEDGHATVRLARELSPDVIIMEVCMPNMNGISATRLILAEFPQVKVIALSISNDKRLVLNMLKAGASGYLLKNCSFKELTEAIRKVVANKTYLSPGITDMVLQDYVKISTDSSVYARLTPRETQVLQLIAEGWTNGEIASLLYVSIKTVETHRLQIMQKLKMRRIADLTKYAISEGLTSGEIKR